LPTERLRGSQARKVLPGFWLVPEEIRRYSPGRKIKLNRGVWLAVLDSYSCSENGTGIPDFSGTGSLFLPLLCQGHALLERVPRIAKTLAIKTISYLLHLDFQRVQCTSDLMPRRHPRHQCSHLVSSTFQLHHLGLAPRESAGHSRVRRTSCTLR
jgi:hypothetical protein